MSQMIDNAPLMLSVSGMRGLVGRSLTPAVVARYGGAVGSWLVGKHADGVPHVVVGRDSRPSGAMFEYAAVAGLIGAGCRVTRVGILSTPGIAVMIGKLGAQGGVAITASHNPLPWNGVKALRHDGVAPPAEEANEIIERFKSDRVSYAEVAALVPDTVDDSAAQTHVDAVVRLVDVDLIRGAKLKAVVDSVCGAGATEARLLLDQLGVAIDHMYAEPSGLFPHTPEPTKENLVELCERVKATGADVGFAQDPDADRLAVVDENGTYIGEEYTLALCAMHKLEAGQTIAANLSTSRMVDDIAAKCNATVVRTAVGEANVAGAMREHHARLGGEGNGGIIDSTVSQVRDSLIGMAYVLEMLAKRRQALSAIVASTPGYAMIKDKVGIEGIAFDAVKAKLLAAFADQRIDTQDGVRVDWVDGWVHVRPSNTEPIVRIIAEARDEAAARELVVRARTAAGV